MDPLGMVMTGPAGVAPPDPPTSLSWLVTVVGMTVAVGVWAVVMTTVVMGATAMGLMLAMARDSMPAVERTGGTGADWRWRAATDTGVDMGRMLAVRASVLILVLSTGAADTVGLALAAGDACCF